MLLHDINELQYYILEDVAIDILKSERSGGNYVYKIIQKNKIYMYIHVEISEYVMNCDLWHRSQFITSI